MSIEDEPIEHYDCQITSYAMEVLPFNIQVLMAQTDDNRTRKALEHILEVHTKLSEVALHIHEGVDMGWDEKSFYGAYNEFRRGRGFDE